MTHIAPTSYHQGLQITPTRELAVAPRAVVQFGTAPDGLSWLLEVDRSDRLQNLFSAVLRAFDLAKLDDLPKRVRDALEQDVAAGLMGVHEVELGGRNLAEVYVSRRPIKAILGRSLISQLLEGGPDSPVSEPAGGGEAVTSVTGPAKDSADANYAEALERAIRDRRSARHLLLKLRDGDAWIGTVAKEDRALRVPSGPYRPMVFESLADFADTRARFTISGGESWVAPIDDGQGYIDAILRMSQDRYGGQLDFEVSRAAMLDVIVKLSRLVGDTFHGNGRLHGDLTPGNVMVEGGAPVSFDALDLKIGAVATSATFEWAAPEQIVGMPLDPRADVYAIGRMITTLFGGVPFGEETQYVVPTGGMDSRRVKLLKTDGVFIDILDTDYDRDWQLAWQSLLGSCLAYDADRRPADGIALADQLAELIERHPLQGTIMFPGLFGEVVRLETEGTWTYARKVRD